MTESKSSKKLSGRPPLAGAFIHMHTVINARIAHHDSELARGASKSSEGRCVGFLSPADAMALKCRKTPAAENNAGAARPGVGASKSPSQGATPKPGLRIGWRGLEEYAPPRPRPNIAPLGGYFSASSRPSVSAHDRNPFAAIRC
jgi:hypothetical protein